MVRMSQVSVTDLKAHLSRYIREARRGGEVQILERGVPVALLTGFAPEEGSEPRRRGRLAEAGILRLGTGDAAAILGQAPLELGTSLSAALEEERTDRL
jgi:prevent-host-death family protein